MKDYQYLIVGGGMTAAAATDGIREVDPTGLIGLTGAEPDAPYDRPPLSKALWKGKSLDAIWRKSVDKGITLHLGRVAKEIIPKQSLVVDDNGDVFTYQKLLLATGGCVYSAAVSAGRAANDYTARAIPDYLGIAVPQEAAQILWQH